MAAVTGRTSHRRKTIDYIVNSVTCVLSLNSTGAEEVRRTDVSDVLLCSEDGTFQTVAGYPAFFQSNREIKMRNLILAVCCAALVGSMPVASAQTTGPAGQQAVKASDPMNANAMTMKKKHKTKKMTKSNDAGMAKDGMKKDTK